MIYSDRIRFLRGYEDIKQIEIAKYLNLNPDVYGHFEREETIMPLKYLIKVCDFLNVPLDYIFNFTDNIFPIKKVKVDKCEVGRRLKEFRKEQKLTQAAIAKCLKTNRSLLSNYEKGVYLISTIYLYTICKKYNISADYLLGRIDSPKYLEKEN